MIFIIIFFRYIIRMMHKFKTIGIIGVGKALLRLLIFTTE